MKLLLTITAALITITVPNWCSAAAFVQTSGETVLSPGSYTYEYVSITGGTVKLVGDVNIICNGAGTAYFTLQNATIYNDVIVPGAIDANNGLGGANGAGGLDYQSPAQSGLSGTEAPPYIASPGRNGYALKIYANGDITIKGVINLSGSEGTTHAGYAGDGGNGGKGGNITGGNAGYGGSGGMGGTSYGGHGGNGGTVLLETHGGIIDFGDSSLHGVIHLDAGNGGKAGHGGAGGSGGRGGNVMPETGRGGNGGHGGGGGTSFGGYGGTSGTIILTALQIHDANLSFTMNVGQGGGHYWDTGWNYGRKGLGGTGGTEPLGNYGTNGQDGNEGYEYNGIPGLVGQFFKTIIVEPNECSTVQVGHYGLPGDVNKDCSVDLADFADMANSWSYCMDPNNSDCDKPWRHIY